MIGTPPQNPPDAGITPEDAGVADAVAAGPVPPDSVASQPVLTDAAARFAAFAAYHGALVCGPALGAATMEGGRPVQYFKNLVLELADDGSVVPWPMGAMAMAMGVGGVPAGELRAPQCIDLRSGLPRHPTLRYPHRPLGQIRYLVLHHSGAAARFDAAEIAAEHVQVNGWPGIGYHYVIGPTGLTSYCQDPTVSSHHAAQFNPVAVGIALLGDFRSASPDPRQLAAAADLLAWLCQQLGLPRQAIRGHGELVVTDCPGPAFLADWKPRLLDQVAARLRAQASNVAAGPAG